MLKPEKRSRILINLMVAARDNALAVRADAFRMCLQSVVASALTYGLLRLFGSANLTWGVFSSLFTLQIHADRSMRQGVGQIVGALGGTVVGLAVLHTLPTSAEPLTRLGIATAVTCLSTTFFPTTNYSIVVAAAIALEPSGGAAAALSRAMAIVLGASVAVGVSLSVLPHLARSRTFGMMAELIDDCRALIHIMPIVGARSNRGELNTLHERFLRHLVDARTLSAETRFRARFRSGPPLLAVVTACESLWHSLVMLDRVSNQRYALLLDQNGEMPQASVKMVRQHAAYYLEQLTRYIRDDDTYPSGEDALHPFARCLTEAQSHLRRATELSLSDRERVQALSTLSFALEQVEISLRNIANVLENKK